MLTHVAGKDVLKNRGRIAERLIKMPDNRCNVLGAPGFDVQDTVLGSELGRDFVGLIDFIEGLVVGESRGTAGSQFSAQFLVRIGDCGNRNTRSGADNATFLSRLEKLGFNWLRRGAAPVSGTS